MSNTVDISADFKMTRLQALRQERLQRDHVIVHDEDGSSKPKRFYKAVIFPTFHVLMGLDDKTRHDVCFHISAGHPLITNEAKEAVVRLNYQSNRSAGDRAIKELIDSCVEMTTDCTGFVFNESVILPKLEPEERDMIRTGIYNLESYLARQATMISDEARISRAIKTADEVPVYMRGSKQHRLLHETKPSHPDPLAVAYREAGIDSDARIAHVDQPHNRPGLTPRPMFFDYLVNKR